MPVLSGQTFAAFLAFRLGIDHSPRGSVFVDTFLTRVRNCHDDERFDKALFNQAFGGFVHAPFHARKGGRRIENVLDVVQIEYWVPPRGETPVALRKTIQNAAPVSMIILRK